jgi:cyclase
LLISKAILLRSSAVLLLALAWAVSSRALQEGGDALRIFKAAPDYYVIEGTNNGSGDAGNIGVYVTGEGVILVDDRFDYNFKQVLAAVKSVTSQPVRYVINTHHHGDHTGGNAAFVQQNVIVMAHANARRHMVAANQPGPPPITFTKESSVFLGGKEVRMYYFGRGHTDGDIAVYIPAIKAVHLGDLMAGTRGVTNPSLDYAHGASMLAWPGTLDHVLALDLDIVVPGHGAVGKKPDLLAHREKVAGIIKRVQPLIKQGAPKEELMKVLIADFDYKPLNLRALDGIILELGK